MWLQPISFAIRLMPHPSPFIRPSSSVRGSNSYCRQGSHCLTLKVTGSIRCLSGDATGGRTRRWRMARRVSMATKGELLTAIGDRYRASGRTERTKILDEFVAVTGYHRKHAIRLLRPKSEPLGVLPCRVHRHYGDEVREALIGLWEASDRLCSKRLKPIIPVLLPALERHGQLTIDEAIRALVLAISPATIDRLLSEVRLVARGGRRRRAG